MLGREIKGKHSLGSPIEENQTSHSSDEPLMTSNQTAAESFVPECLSSMARKSHLPVTIYRLKLLLGKLS